MPLNSEYSAQKATTGSIADGWKLIYKIFHFHQSHFKPQFQALFQPFLIKMLDLGRGYV